MRSLRQSLNEKVAAFLLASIGCGWLSLRLGKDANWDLFNYHFYNAYSFLQGRLTLDFAPAGLQTYLNPILDIPFFIMANSLPAMNVGFIMGGVHGINAWLIYCLTKDIVLFYWPARRRIAQLLALSCAATGMYGPSGISLLGTTGVAPRIVESRE